MHPAGQLDGAGRAHRAALRRMAREVGLGTEKFLLDGRHVGTGGGNHVVMGGAKPEDSPFLRRPDLLKSLLGFWHNHPSLSYLFSRPVHRPDQPASAHRRGAPGQRGRAGDRLCADHAGRARAALAGRPAAAQPAGRHDRQHPPHRVLHRQAVRAESSSGRLGLVELRAMEMPPHPRWRSAQALLLRAGIAAFWSSPYERRLIRWGTRLHDEFMLPHYVGEDLRDALEDLAAHRLPSRPRMLRAAPGIPLSAGRQRYRQRHRPSSCTRHWSRGRCWVRRRVSAAPCAMSTTRSSASRSGSMAGSTERYVLACNGIAVPLTATQRAGEAVAGVRFKAWEPAFGMHPVLPAQTPLVFDIFDRWSGRSIGGLTHHVAHPGRAQLRDPAGECVGGRGASACAVPAVRPHAGIDAGAAIGAVAGAASHPGSAPGGAATGRLTVSRPACRARHRARPPAAAVHAT